MESLNSRFVVTMNTPNRIKATDRYPMGFILSLKITSANSIENTVSPLARRDVSAAEVCSSPKRTLPGQ